MPATSDMTDVAVVAPDELGLAMRHLIDNGRGLAFLTGLSEHDLRDVEHAIWQRFDGERAVAIALRLRCLVAVFSARRLRELFLNRGYRLIEPAVHLAATSRLNAAWGFNPHKMFRALKAMDWAGRRHEPTDSDPRLLEAA